MKISTIFSFLLLFSFATFANNGHESLTANFKIGDPAIESMNAMAFGPEGILFIGDSRTAAIIAIDTEDNILNEASKEIKLEKIDQQIAALFGTGADNISVQDMAVNPLSKAIYLSVHHSNGTPALLKTDGENWMHIPLEKVSHSKIALNKAVAKDAKDRRGRPLRVWAISDLAYYNGKVMVTGLSNEEFSSTFRSIPFPFKAKQQQSSIEIYHAAHGRYETYSPVKTFMPFELNEKPYIIASYTCTPLVVFPMDELKEGQHTKGKTVAELGNRNTPLDIISYKNKGKTYLLLANSNRAIMKIDPDDIQKFQDYLTEPVKGNSKTAGIDFLALPYVNVQQLDNYFETVVLLQRKSNGNLSLFSVDETRL